jgi:methionine aminotransferase
MLHINSKLPESRLTIFTVMSALANQYGAINLGQGFPDFDCDESLKILISKYLNAGKNQYCPMPGLFELREALSKKYFNSYNNKINPGSEITVTAGATQALFTAITAFIHSGDEVILIEPAYDSYRPSIILAGGIPISYELKSPDFKIDWDHFSDLISSKTRMIIINTPHNPIGRVLHEKDIIALQSLVKDKNIIVLSDEVYEHLIYDGLEHSSILKYPQLYEQSLAVYSFGKTFHSTGWKIGYVIAPEPLTTEFRKVHQWNVFSVNSFLQYALADYLKDPAPYLQLPSFYQGKRDHFNELLHGSKLLPLKCEGTYFQLFDYSSISSEDDIDFAKDITKYHGVAAIPLSVFYTSHRQDKLIRLCFAKTEEVLEKAAELLRKI